MNLDYGPEYERFRAEVREWMAANVPSQPLPSFDTEEGFAAHREWERTLNRNAFSAVTWPRHWRRQTLSIARRDARGWMM